MKFNKYAGDSQAIHVLTISNALDMGRHGFVWQKHLITNLLSESIRADDL